MQSSRNTHLSIGLPLLIALFYLIAVYQPWTCTAHSLRPTAAEDSAKLRENSNSLFHAAKYQEALPGVLELHQRYPGNHIYLEMAAEIYNHLGRYDREADFWEEYFDRAPNPLAACPQIGQAYWKQGKRQQAISAFERCLARDPENSDAIFFLAHALELSGQMGRAGVLYERGTKLAPEYLDLQLGLARVRLSQGRDTEARQIALRALAKAPGNADALLVVGLSYAQENNPAKATQYLQEGANLAGNDLDFPIALASLDEKQKDFAGAISEYNKILQAQPDNANIRAQRDALLEKQ